MSTRTATLVAVASTALKSEAVHVAAKGVSKPPKFYGCGDKEHPTHLKCRPSGAGTEAADWYIFQGDTQQHVMFPSTVAVTGCSVQVATDLPDTHVSWTISAATEKNGAFGPKISSLQSNQTGAACPNAVCLGVFDTNTPGVITRDARNYRDWRTFVWGARLNIMCNKGEDSSEYAPTCRSITYKVACYTMEEPAHWPH